MSDGEWEDVLGSGAILKQVTRPGEGGRAALNQVIHFHVVGRELESQRVFQNTRGETPLQFICGDKNSDLVPALSLTLQLMQLGERATLRVIQPRLGYGEKGSQDLGIAPDTQVEYDIEIVGHGEAENVPGEMNTDELAKAVNTRKNRGNELFRQGDFTRALACYNEALKLLEGVSNEVGQSEEARQLFVTCCNNRAAAEEKLGKLMEAKESCAKVLEADPTNFKALVRGGTIALQQNEFEEARLALERAQEVDPNAALVRTKLRELNNKVSQYADQEKRMFGGWLARGSQQSDAHQSTNDASNQKTVPHTNDHTDAAPQPKSATTKDTDGQSANTTTKKPTTQTKTEPTTTQMDDSDELQAQEAKKQDRAMWMMVLVSFLIVIGSVLFMRIFNPQLLAGTVLGQ